ncbi:cytochrome P450 [Desarmillaria tabescens]|uniref:Cytochrome P450 n=1 Tax=Armillaria tabescens TaxID=1929756 RepID=A0AA39N5I0_ARMTA|nr:cytochrome P450 [Desarmillaria tabescens]KAK0458672.1 cytochrome P450 [Desarmillaria tabescens]
MAVNYLPPGPVCLFYAILPIAIPCAAFCILQNAFGLSLPLWQSLAVPLFLHLLFGLSRSWFKNLAIRREAAAQGALIVPSLQESSISIMRRIVHSVKDGYPDEAFHEWSEKYGSTFSFTVFSDTRVITIEPEHVKAILSTQFPKFEKGSFSFTATQSLLGEGIFNVDGDMWKFHRTMTRPLFNKNRISDFDNFERHAVSTIALIKARLREGYPVDFQDVVARFTLDSATDYLFGKDVNSISAGLPYPAGSGNGRFIDHPSNAFVKAFAKAREQIVVRFHRGPFWPLCEFWADEVKPLRQVVNDFIQPTLVEALDRKAKGVKLGKDFESMSLLDCLVESTDDMKLIRDELVNILAAGRDSIACLLTFAVYMMCEHPDMAVRLRSEILEKVGTQRPCEDIRGMQYLRAFLDETLRLYPPVPVNARSSKVATTIPNQGRAPYYVPKDTGVINSVFLMHRRTDLWGPDALEFDPDRFLDGRLHKYLTPNPYIFVPFGAGQRTCLGQQFAYNEASYYLIRLLQKFSSFSLALDVQPAEGIPPKTWTRAPGTTKGRDKIMLGTHVLLYAKGGLWVRMEEAKDETTM